MCSRVVVLHEGSVRQDARLGGERGWLDAQFRAIAGSPASAAA
jgi:hypothetical protein